MELIRTICIIYIKCITKYLRLYQNFIKHHLLHYFSKITQLYNHQVKNVKALNYKTIYFYLQCLHVDDRCRAASAASCSSQTFRQKRPGPGAGPVHAGRRPPSARPPCRGTLHCSGGLGGVSLVPNQRVQPHIDLP